MPRALLMFVFAAVAWFAATPAYAMYSPTLGCFINRDPGLEPGKDGKPMPSVVNRNGQMVIRETGQIAPRPYGGRGYQDGLSLYRAYYVPNGVDPSGLYTMDVPCCCKIDGWVASNKATQATLLRMFGSWSPGQGWSDYGLSELANAGGGRSDAYNNAPKCVQEAIDASENLAVASMNFTQLLLIGGSGYWNPINWFVQDDDYATHQWWLTKIAIERFRSQYLGTLFAAVRTECVTKYGSGTEPGFAKWKACNCK